MNQEEHRRIIDQAHPADRRILNHVYRLAEIRARRDKVSFNLAYEYEGDRIIEWSAQAITAAEQAITGAPTWRMLRALDKFPAALRKAKSARKDGRQPIKRQVWEAFPTTLTDGLHWSRFWTEIEARGLAVIERTPSGHRVHPPKEQP